MQPINALEMTVASIVQRAGHSLTPIYLTVERYPIDKAVVYANYQAVLLISDWTKRSWTAVVFEDDPKERTCLPWPFDDVVAMFETFTKRASHVDRRAYTQRLPVVAQAGALGVIRTNDTCHVVDLWTGIDLGPFPDDIVTSLGGAFTPLTSAARGLSVAGAIPEWNVG